MSTRPSIGGKASSTLAGVLFFTSTLMSDICSGTTCPGAGALDLGFGIAGKVTTDFPPGGGTDTATGVAIQANGMIVAIGRTFPSSGDAPDFAVARYNSGGTLDAGFGMGGLVASDFGGNELGTDVVIQPDGRIVVAGSTNLGLPTGIDFALARYNNDGTLDSGFGTGGLVRTDFGSGDFGSGVALQADGRIIVAGRSAGDFALARYNSDGTLDASFGTGGLVTTNFGATDAGNDVCIQADGRIIVAGSSAGNYALARYNSNGALDAGFGTGGLVTTDFGATDAGSGMSIQADGRIVVAGTTNVPFVSTFFALARYNSDGTLDVGFGTGGLVTTDFGGGGARGDDVAVQADGKIVVAGFSSSGSPNFVRDFALARYNGDGTLDAGFGTAGLVTTHVADGGGHGTINQAFGVAIQADGNIVVAGEIASGDFGLTRYLALNACERIELLIADVRALVGSGALTQQEGNGLIAKLAEAINVLEKQNVNPAIRKLGDFVDQVESHVNSGKLSPAEAQPLIDGANAIIQSLGGTVSKMALPGEGIASPSRFALTQNVPNPFNPMTTIRLQLPTATAFTVSIFDVAGRLVRRFSGHAGPGDVSIVWDGDNVAGDPVSSGVYFYEAKAGRWAETRKMVLSK